MMEMRQSGDNLAAFALEAYYAGRRALDQAVRKTAMNTATELRRIIRRSFGTEWRVWSAKGFASTIRVKRVGDGHYRVYSRASYAKGRTQKIDLLWVFDTAPVVRSGRGKANVAVPIKGQTPIAQNGRRYMSPGEASAAGFDIQYVAIAGKPGQIAFGRRNRHEEFRPMWVMKPSVKEPKRLDLDGLHRKHAMAMEDVWATFLDQNLTRGSARRISRFAA